MIKRIIEINSPAILTTKNRQLVISREGEGIEFAPIEDLGVLILDNPAITHSLGLITACSENNVAVITCDNKHLPSAVYLPVTGNSLQTKTLAMQVKISQPLRKRVWQALVKAKIQEQAKVLKTIFGDGDQLHDLAANVKSGDPQNVESQAARKYWQNLFGPNFKRDRNLPGINAMLNYGYIVIRAAVARAIVGTGLHPSLGVHHRNQYNNFCLADDLVEPLRPVVDMTVYVLSQKIDGEPLVTKEFKKSVLEILNREFMINKLKLPLFVALHYYAASLRKVFAGESEGLEIPRS